MSDNLVSPRRLAYSLYMISDGAASSRGRVTMVNHNGDRGPRGFQLTTIVCAGLVLITALGREFASYLADGHLERAWSPFLMSLLAVGLILRVAGPDRRRLRLTANAISVIALLLVLLLFFEESTGILVPGLDGALSFGPVDLSTLPNNGRPTQVTLLFAFVICVGVLALGWDTRWATMTSAWSFLLAGSAALWVMTTVIYPEVYDVSHFFNSRPATTALSAFALFLLTFAGVTARPFRLPLGPLLTTHTWPLVVIVFATLVLATLASAVVYRVVVGNTGNVERAQLGAFIVQGLALLALAALTVWYAAVQQRRAADQATRTAADDTFDRVLNHAALAMAVLDDQGLIMQVNPAYERLFASNAEELRGRRFDHRVAGETRRGELPVWWDDMLVGGQPRSERREYRASDGQPVIVDATITPVANPDLDEGNAVLEQLVDVTAVVLAERRLSFQTQHDALTGLLNRHEIIAALSRHLAARNANAILVAIVDIDGFKTTNEAYGQAIGDELLVRVARILTDVTDHGDVGRLGSDEFALLLPVRNGDPNAAAQRLGDRLISLLDRDFACSSIMVPTSASVGLVIVNPDTADSTPDDPQSHDRQSEEIIRNASAALAQAKRAGSSQSRIYEAEFHARERQQMALLNELREILRHTTHDQIEAWFQPIVTLPHGTTVSYETLVRWRHPQHGVMPAGMWIETAETSAPIIHRIGLITAWHAAEFSLCLPADHQVSVNVSGAHVTSRSFPEFVDLILDLNSAHPGRLVVELTETTLANLDSSSTSNFVRLVDAGVGLWADDFGTGFSSVAHLRDLPLTGIKLDKSFTSAMTSRDTTAFRIASGLAGMSDAMGLVTVAEGIETAEQATLVTAAGWTLGQGWLFGKPAPASEYHSATTPAADGPPSTLDMPATPTRGSHLPGPADLKV